MPPPNVLYLHSHDTGRYIRPYGHAVPAPNLRRLAEQGVLFRQTFCAGPTCSPSRAALVTGQCPHSAGMIGLAHRGFSLADPGRHIVHTLGAAGYRSTLIGIQHVADHHRPEAVRAVGYDKVVPTEHQGAAEVGPAAEAWLADGPAEPFFLSVGFAETHRGWDELSAAADARHVGPPAPLPDVPEIRRDMAGFHHKARILDEGMGRVLAALDAAGLAERTLVIATTDHGIAFPRMKCNLTDHGIGVMLIVRGPGGFAGGRVLDAMVSQVDLFPTICEVAGIDEPPWLQGRSVLPLLRGEADRLHEAIFAEVTYHAAYEPMRAVRTERYKYIRRFDDRAGPVLPNCDDSPSKTFLLERGWADRAPAPEALYDLFFDPHEMHNVAADPAHAAALEEMRGRLQEWMRATADPLLQGPVPAPKGARVNDPAGRSPKEPVIEVE